MITLDKKYKTRCGYPVEVVATDLSGEYPVLFIYIDSMFKKHFGATTVDGRYDINATESNLDLIEVTSYEQIKKGDVVLVWSDNSNNKDLAIFERYEYGTVFAHTSLNGVTSLWDNCELYAAKGE